jgi:LmbE family N-acetylglucosaminyl deacetylase
MAIGAHPDDIEFGMAGTFILLGRAGCELHYMNVANGSCGSAVMDAETTVRVRLKEAGNAARRLGAVFHNPIAFDLEVFYEKPLLARLTAIIREVTPDILLVPSPFDYMEDHTNTCRLAVMAAFCRGMPNFPVNPPRPAIDHPITVYHAQPHGHRDGMNRFCEPDFFVDIDSVIDEKTEALGEHKSQQAWLDASQSMNAYLQTMQDLSREMGARSGRCIFGEGWRRHNHLGFCEAGTDPLCEILGGHVLQPPPPPPPRTTEA